MSAADALESYQGIKHAVLPRPELDALVGAMVKARDGGDGRTFERLRNRVVSVMLRFVVKIAKRFRGRGLELSDMIQVGVLGLIRSLATWSPDEGASVTTYARTWILQRITRAIDDLGQAVRRPVHTRTLARKIDRAQRKHHELYGCAPTPEEIAARAELPIAAVRRSLALGSGRALSIDAPLHDDPGNGDDPVTILDGLADDEASAEDLVIRGDREALVHELLDALPHARNRQIVAMRFGLGTVDGEPVILEDVGGQFGMSRERARQIGNDAIADLARKARRVEWKRRPPLRLVPTPPVDASFPKPSPRAPRMRATVARNTSVLAKMREGGTDLAEMARIERALEEAARARRKRAKAAADARQAGRAKQKREAKRAEEEAHAERVARALEEMRARNRRTRASGCPG